MKKTTIALFLSGILTIVGLGTFSIVNASNNNDIATQKEITLDDMVINDGDDALNRLKLGNKLYVNDTSQSVISLILDLEISSI